jgi:FMN-dependent NADH-azoreductase
LWFAKLHPAVKHANPQCFQTADRIVLGTPMWNFGVPYKFKQLIDVVAQISAPATEKSTARS